MKLKKLCAVALMVAALTTGASALASTNTYASSALLFAPRTISFAWDPSPDAKVVGYNLYLFTSDPALADVQVNRVVTCTNLTATVSSLSVGTNYWATVTAFDLSGIESAPANTITFKILAVPASFRIIVGVH